MSAKRLTERYDLLILLPILCVVGFAIYGAALTYGFHFDDKVNIVENLKLRDLSAFWPPSGTRYLSYLSFALNYHIAGLDPFAFRLVNILIHIANAALVYGLVRLIFRTQALLLDVRTAFMTASLASFFFLVHPVQTQAVTYITQRMASLATFFYLAAIVCYLKSRLDASARGGIVMYAASVVLAILAQKTKEISFTLPLVLILFESVLFSGARRQRFIRLVPFLLILPIIPITLFSGASAGIEADTARFQIRDLTEIPRHQYLATEARVVVTYLRLLIWPVNQNLDYDYPVFNSIFAPLPLVSLIFIAAIISVAIYLLIRSLRRLTRGLDARLTLAVSLGAIWFFMTLAVESSVIPIKDVIYEHRLYLPMVGASLVSSAIVSSVVSRLSVRPRAITFAVISCLVVLSLATSAYLRNRVWQSERTLWEDVVRKSSEKARGHNNLGLAYAEADRQDDAIRQYTLALRIDPYLAETHNNLGVAYEQAKRIDLAVVEFQTAIAIKPEQHGWRQNLGRAYYKAFRFDDAISEFSNVVSTKLDSADAYAGLGLAYAAKGLMDEAIGSYGKALRLKPDFAEVRNNLGLAYAASKRPDAAIEEFRKAIEFKPDYPAAHNNIGMVYYGQQLFDDSIRAYAEALRLKPDLASAHFNLGLAYFGKGMKREAEVEFDEAVRINPDLQRLKPRQR